MYRSLFALITLLAVPAAFTQSIEVASCRDCKRAPLETPTVERSAARILIKAKCAFPDGTVVDETAFEVDASTPAQEKRAMAERACQPIMDAASARCDELANRVDALKSKWRIAELHSSREHELASEIRQAIAAAPSYCK